MKKAMSALCYTLFGLYLLLPVGTLVSYCFGYTFSLFYYTVFSALTAAVSLSAVICMNKLKTTARKAEKVLLTLLSPLSLLNWFFYLVKSDSSLVVLFMAVSFVCAVILTVKSTDRSTLKRICLVLTFLLILPLCFFSFLWLLFVFGSTNVVKTVSSQNGEYYAEVAEVNQGALGGNTVVDVCEDKGIDAFLFSIKKSKQRVYIDEWGEHENMQIYWKNEHCLVINSEEYSIE